LLDLV